MQGRVHMRALRAGRAERARREHLALPATFCLDAMFVMDLPQVLSHLAGARRRPGCSRPSETAEEKRIRILPIQTLAPTTRRSRSGA